jgi:putative membrane protein
MNGIITNWLMAFFHHLAAFGLFACLVYEFMLIRKPFNQQTAQSLLNTDQLYGVFAMLILIIGFGRVFHFEKGEDYYFHSLPFLIKISLFGLVGILSMYPTLKFISWRKALKQNQVPQVSAATLATIRRIIHIELAAVVAIILCAAMMAKGVGYFG